MYPDQGEGQELESEEGKVVKDEIERDEDEVDEDGKSEDDEGGSTSEDKRSRYAKCYCTVHLLTK